MGVTKESLQPGDGIHFPKPGDQLTMHYTGTLADGGKQFDSSISRGKPFQFVIGIGQVIQGWDEGVMLMSLGEKARLKITSDYGYGTEGAPGAIPPNADLNFDVELLAIGNLKSTSFAQSGNCEGGCIIL
jgi:FK506-binding protein 1